MLKKKKKLCQTFIPKTSHKTTDENGSISHQYVDVRYIFYMITTSLFIQEFRYFEYSYRKCKTVGVGAECFCASLLLA